MSSPELAGSFVAAVVKHHGRADTLAAIGIDRGQIRAADAVVFEIFIKRLDPHGPHALGNQVANRVIHHRAGDAGVQAEAVGEIGRHVEFAAADMDVAMGRLAEGDDAGIEAMDQGAKGEEIEGAVRADIQAVFHDNNCGLLIMFACVKVQGSQLK